VDRLAGLTFRLAGAALILAACGCGEKKPAQLLGTQWPQADAIFHLDQSWLGSDGAWSIPLSDGRVLWLFGDTFVATSDKHLRSESTMVRNTIAIQSGVDPLISDMSFGWKGTDAAPSSFFPEDGDEWFWPSHGVALGDALVIFLQREKATPGQGLGFQSAGWRAVIIGDDTNVPSKWNLLFADPVSPLPGIAIGAVNADADHVFALTERESPNDHAGMLVRWLKTDLLAGNIDQPEWWTASGWVAQSQLSGDPMVVMPNAGPEMSLHFDAKLNKWIHVRSDGFGATTIVVSYADQPQGPWSVPKTVFRPPESDQPNAFVYAAKAHPELNAGGELAVTYATNTMAGFDVLVSDTSLYFPRFVRFTP
jgi:hypothetical protein